MSVSNDSMLTYINILRLQNKRYVALFPEITDMHSTLDLKKIGDLLVAEDPKNCTACVKGGNVDAKVLIIV